MPRRAKTKVLAGLDEAQPDVAEVDVVALAQLDLAVLLAVDPHAVGDCRSTMW